MPQRYLPSGKNSDNTISSLSWAPWRHFRPTVNCRLETCPTIFLSRSQASFKWSYSSLQFTMQQTFWSFDDNVKSSVITEKDNTTKFEILLTFDPSTEILIFILSVSGFTWYLMYRIISISRLTYTPGIFPGIISKWYKLLISQHWETRYFRGSPSQNTVSSL